MRTALVGLLMTAEAIGIFLLRYFGGASGGDLAEAQTAAVTTVILFQVFYLLECRSLSGSSLEIGLFSNRGVYVGIGAILVLQLAFVYLPFMNVQLQRAPPSPDSARCLRPALRAETSAVSDMENRPLRRIRRTMSGSGRAGGSVVGAAHKRSSRQ